MLQRIHKRYPPVCKRCDSGRHEIRDSYGHFRAHNARKTCPRAFERAEWLTYLDNAYGLAEAATLGHMVTRAGLARGITGSAWFRARPVSDRWASEELRAWFRDHGRPLTFTEWTRYAATEAAA